MDLTAVLKAIAGKTPPKEEPATALPDMADTVEATEAVLNTRVQGSRFERNHARFIAPAQDGCVFVVSDPHFTPQGRVSLAYKASLLLAEQMEPYALILNGDVLDFPSISRWPVGSFSELAERPSVSDELRTAEKRLAAYEKIPSLRYAVWNLGNHDARFETRLAEKVPEYKGTAGFTLKEHFAGWAPAWSTLFVNPQTDEPQIFIKHRFKGGEYSAYNNALKSGLSMVTGHDHKLWCKPVTDVHGIRWGIDAGTLSYIYDLQYLNYTEDNPVDWQSGFVILHFRGGKFTGPELVQTLMSGTKEVGVVFRGQLLDVTGVEV